MGYTYTMLYYSAIRRNEIMASSGTEKKVEMIIATEVRETVSKKYNMISLLGGI